MRTSQRLARTRVLRLEQAGFDVSDRTELVLMNPADPSNGLSEPAFVQLTASNDHACQPPGGTDNYVDTSFQIPPGTTDRFEIHPLSNPDPSPVRSGCLYIASSQPILVRGSVQKTHLRWETDESRINGIAESTVEVAIFPVDWPFFMTPPPPPEEQR